MLQWGMRLWPAESEPVAFMERDSHRPKQHAGSEHRAQDGCAQLHKAGSALLSSCLADSACASRVRKLRTCHLHRCGRDPRSSSACTCPVSLPQPHVPHPALVQSCTRKGSQILLQVVDTCDTCSATQLNLPYLTYEQYLGTPTDNLMVSWQQVHLHTEDKLTLGTSRSACCASLLVSRLILRWGRWTATHPAP